MNPRTRFLSAMRGERLDRVPLELPGFHFESREKIAEEVDPLKREIAERISDQLHFRIIVNSYHNRFLCTPTQNIREEQENLPNGHRLTHGTIDTPRGELNYLWHTDPNVGTSWMVKYPCETKGDIEKIQSVPWQIPSELALPDLKKQPAGFEERGLIMTHLSSPFVCVAGMMPYQMFLELCATDLDWMVELTDVCLRRELDLVDVLFSKPGIEYLWMGGSEWVTPPMGSPQLYDTLVQGPEKAIIDCVKSRSNAIVHIHCHGNVRHALPRTVERGGDYTEPVEPPPDGDITMTEAKVVADGKITLGGNIEARLLYNESEAEVEQAAHAAFEGGKQRFVFRPSEGPSSQMTEREFKNYMRTIDVWEELSPID